MISIWNDVEKAYRRGAVYKKSKLYCLYRITCSELDGSSFIHVSVFSKAIADPI